MAIRSTQVAELLTVHRLDSEPLRKGLVEDEALIRRAGGQMQTSMDGMAGAMTNVNAKAVTTQQTFGVLGAQAGALGGVFGAATSSAISFAGALSGIGKAAFGLPGLILAGAAAVGFLVNAFVKQAAAAKVAREEFKAYTDTLKDEAQATGKAIDDMARKVLLGQAATPEAGLRQTQQFQEVDLQRTINEAASSRFNLINLAQKLEHETTHTFASEAQQEEVDVRIEQTRQTEALAVELIRQSRAKLQDDLLKLTQDRLKAEGESEKRAADERSRIQAATPLGRVMGAIQGEIKAALEQQQMGAIFGRIKGLLPDGLRKSIESKLGLTTPEAADIPGGATGRVAFAAGGFTDIAAAGGQLGGGMQDIERRKETRDVDRNLKLVEIRDALVLMLTSKRKEILS